MMCYLRFLADNLHQEDVMLRERMQGVSDIVHERMPHFLCFQVGPTHSHPALFMGK